MHKGIEVKRAGVITRDSTFSPTIIKSILRQAKDSTFIQDEKRDGRLFFLSNNMMMKLMSIPEEIDFSTCAKVIQSEIIGQSVEYEMHKRIIKKIVSHLEDSYRILTGRLF